MLLANLLLELRGLLDEPDQNFGQITALLEAHRDFAEYEVARHYVFPTLEPAIRARVEAPNPLARRAAVPAVAACLSRTHAARVLTRLHSDPDRHVRRTVEVAAARHGFTDLLSAGETGRWALRVDRSREGRGPSLAPAGVRSGLPQFATVDALARWLGCSDEQELRRFMRPGSAHGAPYIDFEIPKAKGGTRVISAPRAPLRAIQRKLLAEILSLVPTHEAAHGFVPGRSTVSNARVHVGARLLLKSDIREFFPTIHYWRVRGLFTWLGYGDVAGALAALCTRRPVVEDADGERVVCWPGQLPQGAPTSPALANLACRRLDARLSGLAAKLGARYTRYADDLSFSFHAQASVDTLNIGRVFWWIDQILHQEGFSEHVGKRQILRPSRRQMVTGIVVNERTTIPREARRVFRATLHNCRKHGLDGQARDREHFVDYLRGYAAYVYMVQPELGRRWRAEVEALIGSEPA